MKPFKTIIKLHLWAQPGKLHFGQFMTNLTFSLHPVQAQEGEKKGQGKGPGAQE